MNEIIFLVEEAAEGGFIARALGYSIYTDANELTDLHANVRDAVACHFEPTEKPSIIRFRLLGDN